MQAAESLMVTQIDSSMLNLCWESELNRKNTHRNELVSLKRASFLSSLSRKDKGYTLPVGLYTGGVVSCQSLLRNHAVIEFKVDLKITKVCQTVFSFRRKLF